jgi:hypothetical protein
MKASYGTRTVQSEVSPRSSGCSLLPTIQAIKDGVELLLDDGQAGVHLFRVGLLLREQHTRNRAVKMPMTPMPVSISTTAMTRPVREGPFVASTVRPILEAGR